MSQPINDNFQLLAALSLDDRYRQSTIANRDAISSSRRFQGLLSFVEQTQTLYILLGGVANSNWVGISGPDVSNNIETVIEGFYVLSAGKTTQLDWEVGDKFRGWIANRYVVGTILSLPVSLPSDIDNDTKVELAIDSDNISSISTDEVENNSTVSGTILTDALNTLEDEKANDTDVLHKTGDENKAGGLGVAYLNSSTINTVRNPDNPESRVWRLKTDVDGDGNYSLDVSDDNSETHDFFKVARFNKDQTVDFFNEVKGVEAIEDDSFVVKSQLNTVISQDFIFYGEDYKSTYCLIEPAGMYIYVYEEVDVYQKSTNKTFHLQVGAYFVDNDSVFYIEETGGAKITNETINGASVGIGADLISTFGTDIAFNTIGVFKDSEIKTDYSLFKNYDVSDLSKLESIKHVPFSEIKKEIRPFLEKLNSMTNTDLPLNIIAIGDSISNFQELGSDNQKTDHTKEPQCLYGNTYLRQIWKTFNAIGQNGVDPESENFPDFIQEAQGNMHYVRLDNSIVTTNTTFIPHGTRVSDNNKIYWSLRQNINGMTTALGGYREPTPDAGVKSTDIGDIALHNHTYFFAGSSSFFYLDIPSESTGFSLVFWGDTPTASFPKIEGGADEFLSNSVGIYVDSVLVETIDPTTFRGQSRVNIQLTPSVGTTKQVNIYNLGTGLVAYWGIEYWTGKSVRLINYAMAGNPAQSFSNNTAYNIDHEADMFIWQMTSLNNVGGDSQIPKHVELGELLMNKNVPIVVTTCHPIVEGTGGTTNYPDGPGTYNHVDYFATLKALYDLGLPFSDTFSAFNKMGLATNYVRYYSQLFIDGTHLNINGQNIYKKLLTEAISFNNSDNNNFGIVFEENTAPTSGTYTPTIATTTNLTSATLNTATYIRVGDIVTVTISAVINVTTTNTLTTLTATLPINRVSTVALEVGSGVGFQSGYGAQFFPVHSQMNSNTTQVNFFCRPTNSGNHTLTASFSYKVN